MLESGLAGSGLIKVRARTRVKVRARTRVKVRVTTSKRRRRESKTCYRYILFY